FIKYSITKFQITVNRQLSTIPSVNGQPSSMDIGNIIPHIEALIFASDKPLTSLELTELVNNAFGFMEDKSKRIVHELRKLQGCKWFITCKNQCFNMRNDVTDVHGRRLTVDRRNS